jgi:EpsI family protein
MERRLLVLTACFVAAAGYGVYAMRPEVVPLRQSLSLMPAELGRWSGRDTAPFSEQIMAVLGVDEYVSRIFYAKGADPVSLYIGYYHSQREGDTIHSPMNCLPGAGWEPVATGRATIPVGASGETITVNRFVIRKGIDRQVVLYWYQSHGRVIASEYWSKVFMVYDAVRLNRSDAALVRVISPVLPSEETEDAAERRATEFTQALYPQLGHYLPS